MSMKNVLYVQSMVVKGTSQAEKAKKSAHNLSHCRVTLVCLFVLCSITNLSKIS